MEVKFSKYHGVGNDFIIVDYFVCDFEKLASEICNRNIGFGADGLIVVRVEPLRMDYYNQDGSRAKMCGNGLRCFSQYVFDENLIKANHFTVETLAGEYNVVVDRGLVEIEFKSISYQEPLIGKEVLDSICYSINTGVDHIVVFEQEITSTYAKQLYKEFKGTKNINFVGVENRNKLIIKTYERGIGFTKACGTGAIASFKVAKLLDLVDEKIDINYEYGDFAIQELGQKIYLKAPAVKIGEGLFVFKE